MVSYRDVAYILPVALNILLFASPVAYAVPAKWEWLFAFNPLAPPLDAMRAGLLGSTFGEYKGLAISGAASVLLLIVGLYAFKRMERRFADVI